MESQYLFVLGNAPQLAEEELSSVLPARDLSPATFDLLGGTVKVAEIFSPSVAAKLIEDKKPGERIVFGLSGNASIKDAQALKNEFEERGFKVRFILPRVGDCELSSVVVAKQKVTEIYIIDTGGQKLTAKTIWVQNFADWNRRDYGRPEAEAHIGMLPPKVARMMLNVSKGETILDPFCGVGTILMEGLEVGKKMLGSDINPAQLAKTKKNLEWLGKSCPLYLCDARQISSRVSAVDAIVTEPFLGPADHQVLERLYLDSLRDWQKILKPGGKVVIALPFVLHPDKIGVDKAKVMGYSFAAGPFEYGRSQAKIKRFIHILTYGSY